MNAITDHLNQADAFRIAGGTMLDSDHPQAFEPGTYIVMNENTLGIVHPNNVVDVLAGKILKGGPNPLNGPVIFSPGTDHARLATQEDFDQFRVCSRGHLFPVQ
jgi:hypothetical protein